LAAAGDEVAQVAEIGAGAQVVDDRPEVAGVDVAAGDAVDEVADRPRVDAASRCAAALGESERRERATPRTPSSSSGAGQGGSAR
jgi:hypothetical protein